MEIIQEYPLFRYRLTFNCCYLYFDSITESYIKNGSAWIVIFNALLLQINPYIHITILSWLASNHHAYVTQCKSNCLIHICHGLRRYEIATPVSIGVTLYSIQWEERRAKNWYQIRVDRILAGLCRTEKQEQTFQHVSVREIERRQGDEWMDEWSIYHCFISFFRDEYRTGAD